MSRAKVATGVIGWREWVVLPDLGVAHVKAKVDTGARTSALHAFDIEVGERDGHPWVRFSIHPWQRSGTDAVKAGAPLVDKRNVRSSSGIAHLRPVIATDIVLAGRRFPIELTLTRRDEMGFRMLIGREALRGKFHVDPASSYRGGRPASTVRRRNLRSD